MIDKIGDIVRTFLYGRDIIGRMHYELHKAEHDMLDHQAALELARVSVAYHEAALSGTRLRIERIKRDITSHHE